MSTTLPNTPYDPLAVGQLLLDRFRVVRRIAQGGMGVVYEAFDQKLDRPIALKCARAGRDRHLLPEVRLATEVSHPNLCKIHEIHSIETPDGPLEFFTMELLKGPTLFLRLKEGPIPPDEAETIARQLCSGLAEAHRHQIIHGDLKPANLILAKNPDGSLRTVITDFGLAHGVSVRNTGGGSPGYMAPELFRGSRTTVATDIYALGVILYELISGYRPQTRAAMLASTVSIDADHAPDRTDRTAQPATIVPEKLPPLGSRWDRILAKCLQGDPAQRYQSAQEILDSLGPSQLKRRVYLGAGAVVLAALAAVGTYWQASKPAQSAILELPSIQAPAALASDAQRLGQQTLDVLGQLKDSRQLGFSVKTRNWSTATHRLAVDLTPKAGKLALHAVLVDLRSNAPLLDWSANYTAADLSYAPVALTGVVSRALHLPALRTSATVSPPAQPHYDRGLELFKDDTQQDAALEELRKAAALDPGSALPYAALAEVQRRKAFLTKVASWRAQAAASLEQAELRNSDCAEVHRIAGLMEMDTGLPERALARMLRATEFQPPHPDAFRRLGEIYYQARQLPEALQAYLEAQRLAPDDVRIYQSLAVLYASQSNLAEASKALVRAVELAPKRPQLRRRLAAVYQDQGRFAEAQAELRTALNQEVNTDTLVQLGHVLLYLSRGDDALDPLLEATKMAPTDTYAWLYLGVAYQGMGRTAPAQAAFHHARTLAEQAVIGQPRSSIFRGMLAYLCAQTGEPDRARLEAAQALQLSPKDNDTIYWTVLAYQWVGDLDSALKALEPAPRALLEDFSRWPEAARIMRDPRFVQLLRASATRP
ncbi:MAG: protein kinase [Acidobacteria bacterium]|nr:protein kinase [Acidobacteriota bacterium]